jgi:hypothetical protein
MHQNHVGACVGGLAVLVLAVVVLPGAALAAAARDGLSTFAQISLYPNIETVGVVVSGTSLPAVAELLYRASGEPNWRMGHPLMRIGDGRLVGSLFELSPATSYDVKARDGATEINGFVTTQPDQLPFAPANILHVNAGAAAGGNGSATAPFRTIQEGVNHAAPGTQVLVADGTYHESVSFPASGSIGNWIQVKAQSSGAVLDGSVKRSGSIWTPVAGVSHVYFTKISAAIAYLARDGKRFYAYDDKAGLNHGIGHNNVAMSEGWWFEAGTLKLFVRTLDDPASHTWQVPTLNHAFDVVGRDWVWIEGFEMRFYGTTTNGCGVCTVNASHIVIRKNRIHNLQLGIFTNWNGTDSQGNDTRIESNEIYDPPVNEWPWNAVKGSSMEGTAVVVRGHIGAIVRGNALHNFFNGIYVGSSAALENSALAFDGDIYNNHIHHIGDDALEPEGTCINQRFRNNLVDTVFVGMSLAPITEGPTWVLRSVFANYSGRGFKWDANSDGIVLVYHNTAWSNISGIDAMDMISPVHNAILRNNIFQSNGYGVYEVATGSTGHDWDNDNWYARRATPRFKWENIAYNTLGALCAATGLECSGYEDLPGLTNPASGDFTLLATSPNIDRGVPISGINDDFTGGAPDVGAFELLAGPAISGNAGIGGASLAYDANGPRTAVTDANGNYLFRVPSGWSGTVTPSKPGYTFSPPSKTYGNLTEDASGQNYTATRPVSLKFQVQSQGAYDGWILESSETSGKGGTMDWRAGGLQVGDDVADRQYRVILSFNTAGLRDDAIVTSAVLRVKQKVAPTVNPFAVLGSLLVDVRKPYFGSSAALQLGDFSAALTVARVGTFGTTPLNAWYSAGLNTSGINAINKVGLTQFRLYFAKDDNDNHTANLLKLLSGNAVASERPLLIITYTVP